MIYNKSTLLQVFNISITLHAGQLKKDAVHSAIDRYCCIIKKNAAYREDFF